MFYRLSEHIILSKKQPLIDYATFFRKKTVFNNEVLLVS